MGKWIIEKVGVKGVLWISRALAAIMAGCAGYGCYLAGKTDGIVDAYETIEKNLNNK